LHFKLRYAIIRYTRIPKPLVFSQRDKEHTAQITYLRASYKLFRAGWSTFGQLAFVFAGSCKTVLNGTRSCANCGSNFKEIIISLLKQRNYAVYTSFSEQVGQLLVNLFFILRKVTAEK